MKHRLSPIALLGCALTAGVLVAVLALPAGAAVHTAVSPPQLLRDYNSNGGLTADYSNADLRRALTDRSLLPLARRLGGGRTELVAFRQAVANLLEARAPQPSLPLPLQPTTAVHPQTLTEKLGVAAMLLGICLAVLVIGWGLLTPPYERHRASFYP